MSRRALSHQGGAVKRRGEPEVAEKLARALAASEEDADTLTHGFHSYPARMHPAIARELLADFDGAPVLDPFCGSGTVLVEARRAGRRAYGVDLNPVGLRVAEVKVSWRDAEARARFSALLEGIAARSEERVRARVDARAPLPKSELRWYPPHVLKELAGLREEIVAVADRDDRRALEMVMSAIITKVSSQRSDTAERTATKRIRKGLSTEFFLRRGQELVERWAALEASCERPGPHPTLRLGDARQLRKVLPKGARAGLVISSPPYGGTYDYVDHHARRYPWLGHDPRPLRRGELGARRDLRGAGAVKRWDEQVAAMLKSLRQATTPEAWIVLLVGDAQLGKRRIDAAGQLVSLAPGAGLEVAASASQERPDFTGGPTRREHLVALRRSR
ncbi:MAG TPA: DNA methyltransferase [Polyangiaceae bacterium LLY-WYZ-15_(1-7)]|nr:hypothetical protein [Myxococcales bacterium]MAT25842.1 hypothetical protein [Sandaracinus sp.]HJL04154.1 DNA methyltransferase [Polyangiaceae bacterium LLY-WYZ-15_(1-7)]MBJ70553.1 hypothetical protein [Sandaracinus sp.]HJL12204.1 DNA methyltransferase [Polyangiaceae bacterium LLY-WYZ-15_(1-7)]